jgi:hypothetical protein
MIMTIYDVATEASPAYKTTKHIKSLVKVLIVTWNFKKVNKVKNDDKRISKQRK